ncbi:hypothetical protein DPMN_091876 [Dreissena polymorpha]|uniref:Uncharacterized protein n=1 Tax=Dreissena polymorpha TaxID=45954 RepID=A0A9D4L0B1_DREPO|nr:hypothetical protein DPMN_091876 [Dreissena polymorpha]
MLVNITNNKSADIAINGEKIVEVTSFTDLRVTLPKVDTSIAKVRIRIIMATAAFARLSRLWINSSIRFTTKNRFYMSFVVSYSKTARP